MTQYLADIKSLVDNIASAGSTVDTEDIILYILNGLPPSYQSFKTAIRTMLTPISLDNLYALLLSEEINLASDASRTTAIPDPTTAFYSIRGRGRRTRGKGPHNLPNSQRPNPHASTICQICFKKGHAASSCWHISNLSYTPSANTSQPTALAAGNTRNTSEWFLDSSASSHLTNSFDNLSVSAPYQGQDGVIIGDGSTVSIANSGTGLLSLPDRKLKLSQLFHSPDLQYNLISISQLLKDNNISIVFDPNGFFLKDLTTQEVLLQGPCRSGLYKLPTTSQDTSHHAYSTARAINFSWHNRLGHPNNSILHLLASLNPHLNIDLTNSCTTCNVSKAHKLLFTKSLSRRTNALELIHSDL
ncbi:hypothetical protein KFK09_013334 [Dendrobium nobile]|uniref:Retrovirus-related Pol polyprotein from transposon TNT 1-94 n=1 Tax=Dendrobium nobile TaxID=94219 RepID=A0A8T3B9A6_DENNO|nr:hypothetical protein KFK09_013334 [Dendrobium nobile]